MRIKLFPILGIVAAALFGVPGPASADSAPRAPDADSMDNAFAVTVKAARGKVGGEGSIIVTVAAKDGYKCNDKYPHKIKDLTAADGAVLTAETVSGTLEGKIVVFRVPVKLNKRGTFPVKGQIRFSVCNDKQCLIKKVALQTTATAS